MLKVFRTESGTFMFDGTSLSLYELPDHLGNKIEEGVEGIYESGVIPDGCTSPEPDTEGQKITRLVLIVTRDCNLSCTYCFAGYVREKDGQRRMPVDVGRMAIEKVFTSFGPVERIQFFGGEPMLVLPLVRDLVEYSNFLASKMGVSAPSYSVTTNGTVISENAIAFIKENNVQVTVSLDGNRDVNNVHRIMKNGTGSYDKILTGINRLRSAEIDVRMEAVFTPDHMRLGESVLSTYKHLTGIGAKSIHLTPSVGQNESRIMAHMLDISSEFRKATEEVMESFLTESPMNMPYIFYVLESLVSGKRKDYFCDAGINGLTVDTNGDVFPCYTLLSPVMKMGNVLDEDFPGSSFDAVQSRMQASHKGTFKKCLKCWARPLCSACYADSFGLDARLEPPQESMCEMIRATTEAVVTKVAEFRKDPEKWKIFCSNVLKAAGEQSSETPTC